MSPSVYETGRFVQTAPDTYTVVFPTHRTEKPKTKRYPKQRVREGLYLSKDHKVIVDQNGDIKSTEVLVVSTNNHNHYAQVFIRFAYAGSVFTGYTVKNPPLKLNYKPSVRLSLEGPAPREHKAAARRPRTRHRCPSCKCLMELGEETSHRCVRSTEPRFCTTCGRLLTRSNQSGLCLWCFRKAGGASRAFNPFYGFAPTPTGKENPSD